MNTLNIRIKSGHSKLKKQRFLSFGKEAQNDSKVGWKGDQIQHQQEQFSQRADYSTYLYTYNKKRVFFKGYSNTNSYPYK